MAEHARAVIDRDGARGRARHRRAAALRPADPRHRLAQPRAADRGLRRAGHRASCARPTTRMALRAYRPARRRRAARVVAGGGLLGLEAAYALHKLGLKTAVLERSDRPAAPPARRTARASSCSRYLEGLGLEIVLEAESRARRRPTGACERWTLTRRPPPARRSPARRRGHPARTSSSPATPSCAVNRGVLVDDRMRTDDPRVLAAGDVAEFARPGPGPVADRGRAGRGRGRERRRRRQAYEGVVPVTILKVVGIELACIGRFEAERRRRGDRRSRTRRPATASS